MEFGVVFAVLIFFGLHVYGGVYCAKRAEKLNKSTGLWAVLGLLFPVISMIIIYNSKKEITWHGDSDINDAHNNT